ncbi:MAG: NusG domain II-containing protein [Clostridia bacterium]|nr:NusG domain II-containing protein [Clostridia bacterium]
MKNFFLSGHFKKGDFIVFFCIAGMVLISAILFYRPAAEAKQVVIYVNSEKYAAYQLDQPYDKNIKVPVNKNPKYGYNHIRIHDGVVTMVESTCPNGDCVKMGTIREAGDILVCLPHKLMVRLEGGEAVDAVSY